MGVGGGEGGGEWSRDRLIKSFECGGERGLFKGPCTVEKKEDNNRVFFFQYRQKREREREREKRIQDGIPVETIAPSLDWIHIGIRDDGCFLGLLFYWCLINGVPSTLIQCKRTCHVSFFLFGLISGARVAIFSLLGGGWWVGVEKGRSSGPEGAGPSAQRGT